LGAAKHGAVNYYHYLTELTDHMCELIDTHTHTCMMKITGVKGVPAVVKPFGPWQRHLSVAEVAGQLQRSGDQAGSFNGDGRQLAAVVGGNQLAAVVFFFEIELYWSFR
jgi:hypothetical protein